MSTVTTTTTEHKNKTSKLYLRSLLIFLPFLLPFVFSLSLISLFLLRSLIAPVKRFFSRIMIIDDDDDALAQRKMLMAPAIPKALTTIVSYAHRLKDEREILHHYCFVALYYFGVLMYDIIIHHRYIRCVVSLCKVAVGREY